MIYLNNIIQAINTRVAARLAAYPKMVFEGIADYKYEAPATGTAITAPVIMKLGSKNAVPIKTDVNSITAYHRLGNTTISVQPGQDYGDGQSVNNKFATDLQLMVIGKTSLLNVFPYDFAAIIADSIPLSMKVEEAFVMEVKVYLQGINHDKRANFNQEFTGVDYFLGPEYFFFGIRYRIEAMYMNGCTNICDC